MEMMCELGSCYNAPTVSQIAAGSILHNNVVRLASEQAYE